jgi:hypothetical protein
LVGVKGFVMRTPSIVRRSSILLLIAVFVVGMGVPAVAKPDRNPNAGTITDITCDNGAEIDLTIVTSRAGHQPSGKLAGVATSVWLLAGPDGPPLFPFFEVPGAGLDHVTTWCTWFDAAEEAWIGGDIILHPSLR